VDAGAVPALVAVLQAEGATTQWQAAAALTELCKDDPSHVVVSAAVVAGVVPQLVKLLASPQEAVRAQVMAALAAVVVVGARGLARPHACDASDGARCTDVARDQLVRSGGAEGVRALLGVGSAAVRSHAQRVWTLLHRAPMRRPCFRPLIYFIFVA
jgi:hypothetical protein